MNLDIETLRATLEEAEYLADDHPERALTLVPDLVSVIRGLVIEHDDPNGLTCRACKQLWPCPTLTTAARLVQDPENELTKILKAAVAAGAR